MCLRRGGHKDAANAVVGQHGVELRRGLDAGKLTAYKLRLALGSDADIAQRHLQVVQHGVEIAERVLAHAHKGIPAGVGVREESLGAALLVAVDELVDHKEGE